MDLSSAAQREDRCSASGTRDLPNCHGPPASTCFRSSRCRSTIPSDNMVVTPHLGYVTGDSFRNHYQQMVEGIDAWFKGEPKQRLA